MSNVPVSLVNVFRTHPDKQGVLAELLKENIRTVISGLSGWRLSRLIAGAEGTSVVIYSEWDSAQDIEAMRKDPRMMAYFPKIRELAQLESIQGQIVSESRP
jgi:quinol monooxygenase YgiN